MSGLRIYSLFCPPAVKDEPTEFQTKPIKLIITLLGKVYPWISTYCWDYLPFSGRTRPLNDFNDINNSK